MRGTVTVRREGGTEGEESLGSQAWRAEGNTQFGKDVQVGGWRRGVEPSTEGERGRGAGSPEFQTESGFLEENWVSSKLLHRYLLS